MKYLFPLFVCCFLAFTGFAQQNNADYNWLYENLEFEMDRIMEPQFPDYEVNIRDFGARNDGLTKNTGAITEAIQHVSQKGGGKVIIPRGIWLSGPFTFRSNVNLHLKEGALLRFSGNFDDYQLVKTSFEGLNTVRCESPINATNSTNIAITGNGIIDGNGDAWRPVKKGKMTARQWNNLLESGGVVSDDEKMWFPSEKSKRGYNSTSNFNVPDQLSDTELASVKDFLRPVMISIKQCKNILLEGVTFQNSPAWNIHPLMSENIIIRNLTVRNPWYSQNGDGLDVESCKNVLVYNNEFDVGDDAMCIKSGKNEAGRRRGMPTENVIFKNNTVYHGHGGFTIGSEMSGGVRNIHVSDCTFIGTDSGLRFKSTRGRGGIVENIYISNIDMINIPTEAIRFNMFYDGNAPIIESDQSEEDEQPDEKILPVTEETPVFRNIFMKNITSTNSETAGFFMGLPEMKLQNVRLSDATLEANEGLTFINTDQIQLDNVSITRKAGAALTFYNARNATVKNLQHNTIDEKPVKVLGNSDKIDFDSDSTENTKAPHKHILSTEKEILQAVERARAGDSLFVEAKNYTFQERIFLDDSGTAGKRIYFGSSRSGKKAMFDFSAFEEGSSNQGIVLKADYWTIEGIDIFKAGDNGIRIQGNYNILKNCSAHECRDTGIQLDSGASNNLLLNCDSYFNADSSLENADGFAAKMDVGSQNTFIGCRAWNNLDDGWDGYLRGTDNVSTSFENCWAFNNGYLKNGEKGKGDGNGFKTGGSDDKLKKHNATYTNCIAVNNTHDGFDHNSNRGIVTIKHSFAAGNKDNYNFDDDNALEQLIIINSTSLGPMGSLEADATRIKNVSWSTTSDSPAGEKIKAIVKLLSSERTKEGNLPPVSSQLSSLINADQPIQSFHSKRNTK